MRKSISIKIYGIFSDKMIKNLLHALDEKEYKKANSRLVSAIKQGNYTIISPKK